MIRVVLVFFMVVSLQAKVYDGVAIVVEDKAITLLDIQKEMQTDHIDAKKAADILIRKKLENIEIKKRKISVTSSEVYEDIKKMAQRNHLSVSELYDAVRETNGLTSEEFQEKIRQKLLSQKLYNAIAMSSMSEPSDEEIKDYFELHKDHFVHPSSFDVIIYDAPSKELLEQKVQNPMFYAPEIHSTEQKVLYNRVSPELARLLSQTPVGAFTPIIPNAKGGYMSFYIKSVSKAQDITADDVHNEIINAIMSEKREAILNDYFARLRDNADIKIIRMPQ
jgi:hypothetical protein